MKRILATASLLILLFTSKVWAQFGVCSQVIPGTYQGQILQPLIMPSNAAYPTCPFTSPRENFAFYVDAFNANTSNHWGDWLLNGGITAVNATMSVSVYTCSVAPTITVSDCGTTINSCGSPSVIATFNPVGAGVINASASATVLATHYLSAMFTAGTCAALVGQINLQAAGQ